MTYKKYTIKRKEYDKKYRIKNKEKIRNQHKEFVERYCQKFGVKSMRETPYGDKIRELDRKYSVRKRACGLVDKTTEYRRWREKNPDGWRAHSKVNYLIRKGTIKRTPCEICGEKETHAHHDNYDKPLEIKWLCPSCHQKYHIKNLSKKSK